MPGITINLQLSISRDSSSSGNWQDTRHYWHSWFQQNRPYGIVSGLMNWKQRKSEFRSGTWNFFPRMVISTSFSYGRNGSDMIESCFPRTSRCGKRSPSLSQCALVISAIRVERRCECYNERSTEALPMCYGVPQAEENGGRANKLITVSRDRSIAPCCGISGTSRRANPLRTRSTASPTADPARCRPVAQPLRNRYARRLPVRPRSRQ